MIDAPQLPMSSRISGCIVDAIEIERSSVLQMVEQCGLHLIPLSNNNRSSHAKEIIYCIIRGEESTPEVDVAFSVVVVGGGVVFLVVLLLLFPSPNF